MRAPAHGILVVNKPAGPTSFGVVKEVRRLLGIKKIGHLGTLDPFAEGVLPLCLNEATKLAPFLLEQDKSYRATVFLGARTDTQDGTGTVLARSSDLPEPQAIEAALADFVGEQWQTPPLYSAVHFQGRRLYQWARQGISVAVAPRRITIMDLSVESMALPELIFTVTCSKGAYIRTLAADLGERLGCGAYLKALQRLRVGPFSLDQAVSLTGPASPRSSPELLAHLIPLAACLPHLPKLSVDEQTAAWVRHGRALPLNETLRLSAPLAPGEQVKIIWQDQLVAVAALDDPGEKIRPLRVFHA